MPSPRSPAELQAFVRERTAPTPVPLCPELTLYTATEMTSLWHATAAELRGWDDSPFWAFPWAGGQALARHVLDHPALVRGRRVLDFASGSGLVGLAAARAGAARVVAADIDPFCAAVLPLNAGLNRLALEVRTDDLLGRPLAGFDVVLAGDVFYERALAERSFAWFGALAASGLRVLAGDPGRNYSPASGAAVLAEYDVPTSVAIEATAVRRTRVLEMEGAATS
ncbi:class I SAM-dependent methyltransferase [Anaeromyxobacter paludicola]|uniref:Nicotinamide N-methylase n=1 Tax=Anaeromyxobacter paludicola TaxID=2918171 RepID=A0ABN6NBU1_9BACT|nr:50S ribosomal protein L11 methyltransferase [Anaeromyxobacter paludicola]BDG10714.1 nicotinamide N-methylase [Anaeromyxobacter paludicola]